MKRLVYSTFVLLFLFSLTTGEQSGAPDRPQQKAEDECWTPGRPKPEVEVGQNGSPVLCGRAISLPKPPYPEEAKAKKISGVVRVNIVIDETGRVIWAEAVEGHPLLRDVSLKAACNSKHSPIKISNRAVKAGSVITYRFGPPPAE